MNVTTCGCPSCGSREIKQAKHTTGAGWGLAVVGLILTPFTLGASLLLVLVSFFLSEYRGRCSSCGWRWRC